MDAGYPRRGADGPGVGGDRYNGGVAVDVAAAPAAPEPMRKLPRTARRILWWTIGTLVFVAVAVSTWLGESSGRRTATAPKAFCMATAKYEAELGRQEARAKVDAARQIPLIEGMVTTAPRKVQADAELFLAKMQEVVAAPDGAARKRLQDDPDVRAAVDRVNRYYSQGCGVFARNGI